MNGRHTSEYSSDLEMSPSDIIEIEESPIKSKKKKKKSFSLDSRNYTCRSSSSRRPEQGKTDINISEIDDRSTLNSTSKKTEGSNKGLKNKSGYKGIKRKASSPKTETGKLTDDSDSSDEELHQRRSSTGKRIKRGLAKRLHRNTDNSQVNQGVPSGSELDSQDGWYSTIKSQSLSSSQTYRHIGSRDSHQPNSKISSRFSHDQPISISTSSSIPKLSADANVLKQAKEPLHKKCITYQDSDPSSEGFEPIISDKGMNHLSPSSSSDDLFLTQTPAKQKPKARKIVSSDTTVDSDATVNDSDATVNDSDATVNDSDSTIYSPLHQNVPDIPDLTLKFMSSSSEEELDKKMVHLVRKNSKSSKKQCYPVGRHREDISTKHTTSHTDINSLNSYHHRNSGESQESESLFGKPPSLSQHINDDDDPYKFPSQSQCRTQSMPSLEQMINSSSKVSTKSPQDGRGEITDQDITTDSDVDVPLASLAFNKYKALKGQSSVKREVSEVDDDGNSEFNLWPQSNKRIRLGPYSGNCYKVKEESEPETQNYSIGSETTHKESAGPDTTSIVDDKSNIKEILVPKREPPSYGYTQDLDVVFVEDSDSDYEDMSQKIVEISSDEDDELQDYDDAAEFKAYFNLPDCDSDDNDLQVRGHRRDVDGDTTSSNTASNIDWVTFDSDDDFSYGLLNQDVSGDDSVYNHPTQKDTENKVKFVKEVVTFDESDDDNYPYGIATQVDKGKQLDRVKDERSHDDMDSLYTADTQLDDVDSNGENARCHDEMDSLYTADTQLDDVDSNGENARCHDEMDSIYSAETQLDDDQRPDVYIDVDGIDEEKVDVKVEILDIADTGKEVSEIDPFDLCMPVNRGQMAHMNQRHHKVRPGQQVMRSNLESNVNQQFKSYRTDWSNKSEKKLKSQSLKKSNKSQTVTSSHERLYEDNVYTVQTQVDGATIRGAGDYEDDIFTAQTQIDGTTNSGTDDNGNDIFSAQTQVDGPVNTSGTDDEDIYAAQTQVDGSAVINGTDDEDIYTAQTQVDGSAVISGTDDEDIYAAQTQVDGSAVISGTDDEDIYAAQTQVDGSAVISGTEDEDIYTAQTQVDGSAVISGTDDEDIYTAQTQVDGSAVISGTDDEDIYAAQTQVDGSAVISGTEDEDIYAAQTQIDGGPISGTGDDENDMFTAQTQVDDIANISGTDDEDIYTAQTQVDGSAVISGTDDEDIYAAQTQVDGSAVISGTDDEDIYTAQTQVDGTDIIGTDHEKDIYMAQTQMDDVGMFHGVDSEEDDIYAAQTQVDRTHIFTSEKSDDSSAAYTSVPCKKRKFHFDRGKMRNQVERARFQIEHKKDISGTTAGILQLNRLLSGEEVSADQKRSADFDSFLATKQKDRVGDAYLVGIQMDREGDSSRKEDSSDVYMAETQIDNIIISRTEEEDRGKTHVSSKTITGHKNTPVNSEEQMDTESYDVEVQYDLPSPNSTLPIPKEKHIQREKSIVSSIDKIRFKNLIPIKKTVLPTEPQRLKNRCKKSESFRIEKSTFYSKKSGKVPYQNSASKKLTSSMDGWLSTARSSKSRVQPETKRSRSKKQPKEQLDNSQQIKAKMSKARAQMSSRKQSSVKPTAHRKTSISASTGYDTDVQLPNQDEILSKQLPLLTMMEPGVKSTNTSLLSLQPHEDKVEITENQQSLNSSTAPPDKNKANEERSGYIESMGQQDSKYEERSQRPESEISHKKKGSSSSSEQASRRNDSGNKEKSQRPRSGSSGKDHRNREKSQRLESGSNRHNSGNKDRSLRSESWSSRKDSGNKERSSRSESRSSKKDSENKKRSQRSESESSKKDSENKDRSPRSESRSSRKDSENKDRSPRPGSRSSRKDSENKDRSPRPESRSSRKDSENKDRSQKPESGLGKKDSENKNRSQRSESGSSRKDSENKERSPILESGSSKKHNRKERLSSLESGLSRMENSEIENRNKERPPGQESSKDFSGRIENMNEKMLPSNESGSFNTKFSDPNVEVNLDSVSGNINLDEHHILDMNSRKQTDEMTGTKENRPPAMPEMISNTVNDCSASKACIPSSTAHDILSVPSQPHAGKMIRRKATGPKSILTLPENRRKKPHRKVTFDLQQETPREVPFTSRLARSILAQKERLPLDHQLRGGGKVAQPSRSINQSEGRNATVSCLNQPGSFVRTPQTIPKACTPTSRPQNLMEKKWASTQSHMNKPFTDITGAKNTPEERQYSLDNLLVKLLQWNPVWLQEQEKYSYPPPAIEAENPLIPLGESYSSFDDYIQLFTPHIIMETWETAVSGFKQRKESGVTRHTVHFSAAETSVNKKFIHHTWNGVVTGEKFTSNQYLCDEDLVIIKYVTEEPDPSQPSGPPRYTQRSSFGFLEKVTPYKAQDIPRLYNELPLLRRDAQALGNQNVVTLKLKLKIRNGRNLRLAQQPATLQKVVSLISIVRQYNALVVLRRNILWKHILEPGRTDVFAEEQPVTEALRSQLRNYNPSQQKAICTAAKVAVQPFNLPRICLLQGPPGTGKSHTIVGIIDKIIRDTKGQGRICLCTPSNAAVDEVIRRLIYHKRNTTRAPNHLPYGLHMVRIGKMSSIHKDVAKYTFTELVHRHRQNEISRKGEKNFPQSSRRELASLSEKISALSSQLENMEPGDNSCVHKKRLQADLQKMEQKKTDLHYQLRNMNRSISLTPAEEYEIKKNVLWRAHVICGTLNSFGSSNIQNLLRTRHPSNQSSFFFNCIVMDEASQGTELDCLIPLQYGTSKLIMVGDPEQLSPTVLSRKAEEKCFGQSMFERMYGYYKYKETSPVILLDTQYRMNPEIAIFPSQFVYGGRLLSDRCVEERGHNFPLKPYLVFNVEEGQEQSSQAGSVKNEAEACFVAMLCKQITRYTDIPQTDIGIIAPYQSQKSLLVENLKQWKMTSIEVGTVDGFQGREKEVIIMSCVRASSSGGIGFVANRKRMNVALTRARSAMYVVGNLSSLKRSGGDWEVLIEDARKRKVVQDCGKQTNYSTAVQVCFKRLPT